MLNELANDRVDAKKPREEGLSFTIDKLRSFDRENFEIIAPSEKDAEFFSRKHYLKCESCHWTTSYIDVTGYLDIRGKQVKCPTCKKGIIEVA